MALGRQRRRDNGPNDADASFGPLVSFFFIFLRVILIFSLFLGATNVFQGLDGFNRSVTTRTGPNDASGVVWAISKFFFLYFFVFFFTTYSCFRYY